MKLKGDWKGSEHYDVDDVVRWENGDIFTLINPCPTGITPVDTMYWGKVLDPIASVISMVIDLMNYVKELADTIPTNVGDESIVLKSGDNEYLVSVDDSGDTPEVIAELIEAEGGES